MATTSTNVTESYNWMAPYRESAPDAMKAPIVSTAVNLASAARTFADDLDKVAALMARTAELVRRGDTLTFASNVAEARDFARLADEAATYEATAKAWSVLAAAIDAVNEADKAPAA